MDDLMNLTAQYRSSGSIRLFQIEKIVFDKKENVNDKLISVYSALQDVDGSALMILNGSPSGTSMYVGVRSEINAATAGRRVFCGNCDVTVSEYRAANAPGVREFSGIRSMWREAWLREEIGSGIPFASLSLTVEEHNYASSLKIQAKDVILGEGRETGLAVEAAPKDAEDLGTCRWISSDPRVASVDPKGVVRGISGGTARITVKGARAEDSVTVRVLPRIRKITISSRNMELFVGDRRITAVDTQPKDCYDGSWNWTSTDSHVAVMSLDRGYPEIVAKGIGNCIITVRANDGTVLDNCTVTVASTFYRKENRHTDLSISLALTLLALAASAVWLPAGAVSGAAAVVFAVRAINRNKKDLGYGLLFITLSLIPCFRTALWAWTDVINHLHG